MKAKLILLTLAASCLFYSTRAQGINVEPPVRSEKHVARDSTFVKVVRGINASIKSRYKYNLKGHIESVVIDGVKGMETDVLSRW